jgi:NAD(P)-dependent dehydrogenase (short-subunit alcohol dehydrogenase family)
MSEQSLLGADQARSSAVERTQLAHSTADLRCLTDQVAVITGAAGGVGRATAELLSRRGARLVLVDLVKDRLEDTCVAIRNSGGQAADVVGDVCDAELAVAAVQSALDHYGQLDILINNAGAGSAMREVWKIEPDVWRRDIDVNLNSAFQFCQAGIPHMLDGGYGRIVNVASAAGMEGHAMAGGYAAAKAGLIAMTKVLGKELATHGVVVNAIAPALIDTGAMKAEWFDETVKKNLLERIPMGRLGLASEVAEMIAFLASPAVSFSTGAVFDVSGGRATY